MKKSSLLKSSFLYFSVDEDLQVLIQDPGGRTLVLVPDPDQDPSYFSYPCVIFLLSTCVLFHPFVLFQPEYFNTVCMKAWT